MDREPNLREKRAYPRSRPKGRSSLVLLPDNIVSYSILDISEHGVAFSYDEVGIEDRLHENAKIDFFGQTFGLTGISVRIVSDCSINLVNKDDDIPDLRRCGLEFVDLSDDQKRILRSLVDGKIS